MNSKNASFGPSKSAPGIKKAEAVLLDKEAKEMEQRLKNLQDRIQKQNMEDMAAPKFGGSRWKSARPDKGSVLSYAKDVHDKHRKANIGDDPAMRPQVAPRSASLREKVAHNFKNKDIDSWTVNDVNEWLVSAQLSQYSASFIANEISGLVLLDLTLDDLDYMGVSILGHRKIILKSIEDLRKNKRITLHLVASHESNKTPPPVIKIPIDHASNQNQNQNNILKSENKLVELPEPPGATPSTVHWSHLEPLCNNQVPQGLSSSAAAINAADEERVNVDEFFDEAAERAAFQEAVAGWRGSGGKVNIVRESENSSNVKNDGENNFKSEDRNSKNNNNNDDGNNDSKNENNDINNNKNNGINKGNNNLDDSMWCNPFAQSINYDLNNNKDISTLIANDVKSIRNNNINLKSSNQNSTSDSGNQFSSSHVSACDSEGSGVGEGSGSSSMSMFKGGVGSVGGYSLTEGGLDEAGEHEEFKKAVDAWRNRGKEVEKSVTPSSSNNSGSSLLKRTGLNSGDDIGVLKTAIDGVFATSKIEPQKEIKKNNLGASAAALAMAAKIEKELENEQIQFQLKIKEQKQLLEASFKAKDDMKNVELNKLRENKEYKNDENEDKEESNQNSHLSYSEEKFSADRGSERGSAKGTSSYDISYKAKSSSFRRDPGPNLADLGPKSGMEVNLLSTVDLPNKIKNRSSVVLSKDGIEDEEDVESAYIVDEGSDED